MTAQMAAQLEALFRGHPARHLAGEVPASGGPKLVRTVPRGLRPADFERHLAPGPAVVGALPGWPDRAKAELGPGERARWLTDWLALDLDGATPAALASLVARLVDLDLTPYTDRGTTGRGARLHLWLEAPLGVPEAHRLALVLARLTRECGCGTVELRPSSPGAASLGLLLPYRNAAADGFGFNPLVTPNGDPVPLAQTALLKRCDPAPLLAAPPPARRPPAARAVGDPTRPACPRPESWEAELARLAPLWTLGRRQHLAAGAAAAGLNFGVPPARIRADLGALARAAGDEELPARLRAVDHTLQRHAAGKAVSCGWFYAQAGIGSPGPSEAALGRLDRVEAAVAARAWRGRAALGDRAVLLALVALGRRHGREHGRGVAVGVSVRALAEEAGRDAGPTHAALKRLEAQGAVSRERSGKITRAGHVVLLEAWADGGGGGGKKEGAPPKPRGGRLSVTPCTPLPGLAPLVLEALEDGPMTRNGLARALGRDRANLSAPLKRLEGLGVLEREGTAYRLAADLPVALERAGQRSGATARAERRAARHAEERRRRREALAALVDAFSRPPEAVEPAPPAVPLRAPAPPLTVEGARAALLAAAADPSRYQTVLRRLADPETFVGDSLALGEATVLEAARVACATKLGATTPPARERRDPSILPPAPPPELFDRPPSPRYPPGRSPSRSETAPGGRRDPTERSFEPSADPLDPL